MRYRYRRMSLTTHFKLDPTSPSGVAWARDYHKGKAGDPAGSPHHGGYWGVSIDGVFYSMHRVVYYLTHGHCPEFVDHKDRDPSNNTPSNLRPATRSENGWNSKLRSDSTTGVKGLSWVISKSRWVGLIRCNGKAYTTRSKDRAVVEAWLVAKRAELHGEFSCP